MRGPKKECPTHSGCEEREPPVATLYAPLDPLDGGEAEQEAYIPWAALLRRVHHVDMLACPCGGKRRFVSYVTEPEKIREGLEKFGLWSEAPPLAKAREPPQEEPFERRSDADDGDPPPPDFAA